MTFSFAKRIALAAIVQRERKSGRTINGIARELKISWATTARLCDFDLRHPPHPHRRARKECARVVKRRAFVARLAATFRGPAEFRRPAFPSLKAIAAAIHRALGVRVSTSTIRRDLKARGFVNRVRRVVPTKEARVVAARLKFCNQMSRWSADKIRKLVFSDEHWISINDYTCRTQWVKAKLCGRDLCTRQRKRLQNTARLQLWAAAGVDFKGPLVLFPQKGPYDDGFRLNGESYVRRCLVPTVPRLVAGNRILIQDGARPHVRFSVKQYMARKKLCWVENWPPYSPDLNMIESIWPELNRRIGQKCPKSLEELVMAAKEAWDELPQAVINAHCMRFAKKVAEVARNRGEA